MIEMTARPGGSLATLHDRAILLPGFAVAFRRSEPVVMDLADARRGHRGLRVTIRRAKTDQEGSGGAVAIVRGEIACPVAALRA